MSASDQGNDDKGFLARWSQRKQEAKQPERDEPVADPDPAARPATEAEVPQEFDLSSLPSLDELTPETDITAFLRKGVPEQLRNAALRKSWALDPAIRNYVNPALDYAYDWNAPGGVPGSSELGAGIDVARLVSQIMGTGETAAEPSVPAAETRREVADAPAPSGEQKTELPDQSLRLSDQLVSTEQEPPNGEAKAGIEAGQKGDSGGPDSAAPQQVMRRHGSAKPTT
jgi:Protein of unknown function (DUF3306)